MKWPLLILLPLLILTARAEEELCPTVILHGGEELDFTDVEERLVCGDRKLEAWRVVPAYQASFFMTGFLQSRGYLQPEFETKNGILHVHVGKRSQLKRVHVHVDRQDDENLEKRREQVLQEVRRKYRDQTLNPQLVDQSEQEALRVMRRHGHPCTQVESSANANDNVLDLQLKRTNYFPFGEIEREKIDRLAPEALIRFEPFQAQDDFDERLLRLTEKRMLRADVVQGTYFLENCSTDGTEFSLSQHFIPGPPRTLRYGFGASTEVGPMARVRWANHRYRPMASLLAATVEASFRTQLARLTADLFLWREHPRRSFFNELELRRDSQFDFIETSLRARPHMKWTRDRYDRHWRWTLGPTLEYGTFDFDEADADTRTFANGALEGSLLWMSHVYEFYDTHPQQGDSLRFDIGLRHPAVGFAFPLLKLDSSYVTLHNLTDWGRGSLIAGLRLLAGTTFVNDEVSLRQLPPSLKHYGGGSDDIRGFLLRTLPKNDGLGALTKLGAKFELRRTALFIPSVEGFVFADGAHFGERSWDLEPRIWHSPGVGVRWFSPIGIVQGYVARSLVTKPYEDLGNFFFVGLGGTF